MQLVPAKDFTRWELPSVRLEPNTVLRETLIRLESFDLEQFEAAKITLSRHDTPGGRSAPPAHQGLESGAAGNRHADRVRGLPDRPEARLYGNAAVMRG